MDESQSNAVRADAFRILAASHVRIEPPFAPEARGLVEQTDLLADCIGVQVRRTWDACGREGDDFVLSSTVMSSQISGNVAMSTRLFDGIERRCGRRPLAIMDSYMCTGWGFALRMFANRTGVRSATVVIADVDVEDLQFRRGHRPIGHMSFGITVAVVGMPTQRPDAATCDGPFSGSAFNDLVWAMKKQRAQWQPDLTLMPFVREEMDAVARRVIGADGMLPNRFPEYGHCFGSDTWISVTHHLIDSPAQGSQSMLMGAIAFNGYYTICKMLTDQETRVSFDTLDAGLPAILSYLAGRNA